MAVSLEHIHLLAPNHRATAQWYIENLGARFLEEYEAFGLSSIALNLVGIRLRVSTPSDGRKLPGTTVESHYGVDHFGLLVEGLEGLVAQLEQRGVEVLLPVQEARPGLKIAFVRGPDDTRIELLERS